MDKGSAKKKQQGLVFISIPIVGHLIPMVALAKLLIPRFSITILTMNAPLPSWAAASAAYLRSLRCDDDDDENNKVGREIRFVELPQVEFAIDESHHAFTTMSLFIDAHKSNVKRAILDLDTEVVGVVTDFVTSMIDAANELDIPAYVYFPSSAACLSIMVYPPSPSQLLEGTDNMVEVVGISAVPASALPGPMTDPDGYDTFTYHGRRFNKARGIIVNTFEELEPRVVEALSSTEKTQRRVSLPPVYTVGPVLSLPVTSSRHDCIRWLDGQPPASVAFLCFGSMGSFRPKQVKEIALGLERSEQRFLWVLRGPSDNGPPVDADLDGVGLPMGFLDRTRKRGLIWPCWAPQLEILLHEATGGFVTHCGWNSFLEGVWAGVPMLAWPLYAEQKFNACEMVNDIGVAIELVVSDGGGGGGGLVKAEEVERGLRCLMITMGESSEVGKKVRSRTKEMKEASRKAVATSGSSHQALNTWIQELTRPKRTNAHVID